ncbi:MAG: insulinase family protein [Ruminococcaceae bacterium]|nr:insulinase family protein [Oscillospiraceae bacterium]
MKKEFFESDIGESYVKAELSSGLKIFILEKPQYTTSYAIFGTKYGSIDTAFSANGGEKVSVPEGIAHFLEHKLFESEDGDAFSKYAKTGAYANAFTSFDKTCYLFSCADKFYENLDILLTFVQSPYFTEQTVQKEQGIIGQEIKMYEDSPAWRVMFNMLMAMYHNHPVRIDIAGTTDSISKIDAELLYKCYNTFYSPSNMFICIAGNIDADKVLKVIEEKIKPQEPLEITRFFEQEPETVVKPYTEQKLAVAQPMFCFGFKEKTEKPQRSVKEKICSALLLEIIASDSSPLYKQLTNDGLINDEFSSEYFSGNGYCATIFEGESKNPAAVAEAIKNEVKRLKAEGIDKKLFSAIRCGMYGNAIRLFDSVEGIAMQLVDCAMNGSGLFDELKYLKSVTKEDVERRLELLDCENTVLSVINPMEEI